MTCQACHGLGSTVKTNCSTGQFEVVDCRDCYLLHKQFYQKSWNTTLTILSVQPLTVKIREYYDKDYAETRVVNRMRLEEDIASGLLSLKEES